MAARSPSERLPWAGAGGQGAGRGRWVRTVGSRCSGAHTRPHTEACLAQVGAETRRGASSPEMPKVGDKGNTNQSVQCEKSLMPFVIKCSQGKRKKKGNLTGTFLQPAGKHDFQKSKKNP